MRWPVTFCKRHRDASIMHACMIACLFFAGARSACAANLLIDAARADSTALSAVSASNSDIYGRWRIAKVLGAADIAAMSDKQARALIGKPVEISENAFVFNGERCETPSYDRSSVDLVASFRQEGHASAAGTGLPDPVTSIDARCTHIFLKRPNVIVIHWNGFYFDAVRR